jgi:hypothetical protein
MLLPIALLWLPLALAAPAGSPGGAPPAAPPAHQPVFGGTASAGESRAPGAALKYQLPVGWAREQPGSSMRIAQATIPGPAGPGHFAIFYFGAGGGGGAEDNIARWVGQIDRPAAAPRRESFVSNGLRISWVEVAGTLKPSTIGMGPATAQPGSRLLGAVVEGPGGPWYFKATGPDATLVAARGAFLDLLRGLRPPAQ